MGPRDQAPTSGAGEGGLAGAVLEERGDADAGVVGAEHVGEELLLQVEAAVQGDVEPAVDGSLGEALGDDGARRQLGGLGHRSLGRLLVGHRSEEHTSELQSLMRISYAVFCLTKKKRNKETHIT